MYKYEWLKISMYPESDNKIQIAPSRQLSTRKNAKKSYLGF